VQTGRPGAATLREMAGVGTLARRGVALLAAVAVAALCATPAFAHAEVVSTSPQDGVVVSSAPAEVRIRFDDPVTVGPGNAVVATVAPRDSVLAGRPRVAQRGHELVLPLRSAGRGDYSVRWGIVSDDGHVESGVLAFRVGPRQFGAGAPRSVLEAESGRPSAENVFARWLFLGGILVAGGTAFFWLLVSRAGARQAATTLTFALSAVVVGGSWLLLTTHADATRFGHVTDAAVLVAAGGTLAAPFSRTRPRLRVLAMSASLVLLAAPTLSGHAFRAASERPLSVAADLLHVGAAAFWIGGLVQLALTLWAGNDTAAARRFSKLALPAVVLIALSGLARALVELTGVSQLWSTGYGRAILVKSGLLALLILLAWLSRHRLGSATRLLRRVSSELVVLGVLVGAVAVLVALRPGRDVKAQLPPAAAADVAPAPVQGGGSVTFARQSRELAIALAVRPGLPLRVVATIIGQSGRGVDDLHVQLAATNSSDRASASAAGCGNGCYTAQLRLRRPRAFAVNIAGAGRVRSVPFAVGGSWPPRPATSFLHRANRAFRRLRSAVFVEALASKPGNAIETTWRLATPDRIEYAIRGGAAGIVIGGMRWDRPVPGGRWRRSEATALDQPSPPWGTRMAEVRLIRRTGSLVTLSWLDPKVPAWYTGTFDRRTALPTEIRMTAAAHFMLQRYVGYNRAIKIEPPTQ
jgi:copper transport protein